MVSMVEVPKPCKNGREDVSIKILELNFPELQKLALAFYRRKKRVEILEKSNGTSLLVSRTVKYSRKILPPWGNGGLKR